MTELHPGKDGFFRVVTLRTVNGEINRPVNKLVRLPLEQAPEVVSEEEEDFHGF